MYSLYICLKIPLMGAAVFGSGNLAWHLIPAISKAGMPVFYIYSRNVSTGQELAELTNAEFLSLDMPLPQDVDFIFLMIPDDQIIDLSPKLAQLDMPVVHMSGSLPLEALNCRSKGVLYPLQTFSKRLQPEMHEVPFFVEANNETLLQSLFSIASRISHKVTVADSYQRRKLHLAAVFASNFVNHLYQISLEVLKNEDFDSEVLRPLILETAYKAMQIGPAEAQTGPARRNDAAILHDQQKLLQSLSPQYLPLYRYFTESIQNFYKNLKNEL